MTFEAEWVRCSPWLDAALAHSGRSHNLDDVAAMVRMGQAYFWPAANGAGVALIEDNPQDRRLVIWLAGGERSALEHELLPQVEDWGRANGCTLALIVGRPGWERSLKTYGYAPVARLIAKDLRT